MLIPSKGEINKRQQILLALLGVQRDGEKNLDPIRIMKALFLLDRNVSPELWLLENRYNFEPYLYGPYSKEVYDDLLMLEFNGLINKAVVPYQTWALYSLTEEGRAMSMSILDALDKNFSEYIKEVFNFVTKTSFSTLLKKIYSAYPDYAVNSVFRDKS